MLSRGTVIAGLVGLQLFVVAAAVVSVMGGFPTPSSSATQHELGPNLAGPRLVVGGSHHIFDASSHPSLTVDIGYADLTVVGSKSASKIDVSLGGDPEALPFGANGPITARADDDTIRVAKSGSAWSMGDDRMVTVVVPPDTRIDVVNAGDIKVSGMRAEASISSVGNGSITVEDYNGPSLRASARGRILLQQVVAELVNATSRDDSVEGSALHVHDGSIDSDDHMNLGFAPGSDTLVTAEASDGKVLAPGFPDDSDASARKDDSDSTSRSIRLGSGAGRLEVHASDGNITLTQEN